MIIYMQITDDKYGLPVLVADKPTEIDDALGRPRGTVCQSISRARRKGTWCPFIKVDTENSFHEAEWKPAVKKQVVAYYPDGKLYKVFDSLQEASEEIKKSKQVIRNCANGKQKQAGGFVWKWEEIVYD